MKTIVPEGQSRNGATTDRSGHGVSPENATSLAGRGHIGLVVAGSVIGGLVAALVLVLGPFAGAQEDVISGTALLAFASGWALLAVLSMRRTDQPQRWAAVPAAFMASVGAVLLIFAPSNNVLEAVGWV